MESNCRPAHSVTTVVFPHHVCMEIFPWIVTLQLNSLGLPPAPSLPLGSPDNTHVFPPALVTVSAGFRSPPPPLQSSEAVRPGDTMESCKSVFTYFLMRSTTWVSQHTAIRPPVLSLILCISPARDGAHQLRAHLHQFRSVV